MSTETINNKNPNNVNEITNKEWKVKGSGTNHIPECTSESESIVIDGLTILNDFVTIEEELQLLESLEFSSWKDTLSRKVQHYGFNFNYKALMLDFDTPATDIPSKCQEVAERIIDTTYISENNSTLKFSQLINQLTVNEYLPGQGIAPHIDTEACIGPIIYVINLGAGIVMTMKNKKLGLKKNVWIPQRSLYIMTGDARYEWSHGIKPRSSDVVDSILINRSRRVSLTFRQALLPSSIPNKQLGSTEVEKDHVFRVYDNIAVHWNHTRGKRKVHWHRVKTYLEALPKGSWLADIGAGDGKYFGLNPDLFLLGCDRSVKLLEVSYDKAYEVFCCDAVKLPLRSDIFDATLCIAVLHHLATIDRRVAAIRELVRITRPGGSVMIQAWAMEQGGDSKRQFEEQEVMVPWKLVPRFFQNDNKDEKEEKEVKIKQNVIVKQNIPCRNWNKTGTCIFGDSCYYMHGNEVNNNNNINNNEEEIIEEIFFNNNSIEVNDNKDKIHDELTSPEGKCEHVVEKEGNLIFQRYCHVYKEGELEALCACVPGCKLIESGWDKGNWFVQLEKVFDKRLGSVINSSQEFALPEMAKRL
jgi:alkylated DNA repair protein alkB family protein 8